MRKYLKTIVKIIFHFTFLLLMISCHDNKSVSQKSSNQEISNYVNHLLNRHKIPGLALAVVKNDSILMQQNFGYANVEHQVPITDESIFRVYSITKLPVAITIFQLMEQKKLSLDNKLSSYFDDIPESWKKITIKNLLTHSSGLPAMRSFTNLEKLTEEQVKKLVYKKENQFEKGEHYNYNQTNFWLLQKIITKVSGVSFRDFVLKNQFKNGNDTVFFSSNSRAIIPNRVTAYFPFRTGSIEIDHPTLVGNYMFAANGLNITLKEFIKWDKKLRKNELISNETKQQMWETFTYTKSDKVFTNGWDKRIINNHISYGFSGSLVTAYRTFPKDNLSIIFLANGMGNYFNIENTINHIASLVDKDIVDLNNTFYEELMQSIVDKNINEFENKYNEIEKNNSYKNINLENMVNDVGYQLINQKRMEKAIEVFTFNTLKNPVSANAFDSLADAYYRNSNDSLAVKNYNKAIKLGGTNGNAKRMVKRIKQ